MSDPVIDSRSAQTVPPPDGGSPPRDSVAPADASVSPDAAASTDATASTDTSATPPASSGSSSTPAASRTSSTPATSWSLELDGFVGPSRLGGPHGTVFSPDFSPANEGWNFARYGLGFGATHRWNLDPHFRIGVGGRIGYFGFSGDRRAPGRLDGGDLSLHAEIGVPIIPEIEPVLRAMVTGLLATGETTAGNNFSVDQTGGVGLALRALLGVRINLGQFAITPYFTAETGFIPNARGNASAPWVDFGGGVMASWNIDGNSPTAVDNSLLCDEQTPARVRREITRLQGETATLRADEPRLREEARTSHPELTDAQLDEILGTVPASTHVPNPLPTDCTALVELQNQLDAERDALDRRAGMLAVIPLIHGGAATPEVIHAVTQIRNVQFGTRVPFSNTPVTASDRMIRGMDANLVVIENVEQNTQAAINAAPGGRVSADTLRGIFQGIFLNTYRPDGHGGRTQVNPSMDGLNEVAEGLRGLPDRYRYIIVGSTDSRGDDDYNMRLSDRRARATSAYLRAASGLSADHFISLGLGETELMFYYDQLGGRDPHVVSRQEQMELRQLGITGTALRELVMIREGMNRGVQVIIYDPQNPTPLARRLMDAYNARSPGSGATTTAVQVQTEHP